MRSINTCMHGINAQPGDQIHCLVGGTYLVRADGETSEISLRPPKPILEKTYGIPQMPLMQMEDYAKVGWASKIEKPSADVDYREARERVRQNTLEPLQAEVVYAVRDTMSTTGIVTSILTSRRLSRSRLTLRCIDYRSVATSVIT